MRSYGYIQNPVYTIATLGKHGFHRTFHLRFYAFVWYIFIFSFCTIRPMIIFVRHVMGTPLCLGVMGAGLILLPIAGMWAVHKYNWQHWAPFDGKKGQSKQNQGNATAKKAKNGGKKK